jgi:hypothetical protein
MTIESCMRSELAGFDSRGGSAFLAGTVKRNTPLRFRLLVTCRMTLQARVKCPSRVWRNGGVFHRCHLPCVREQWAFLWRSGNLRGARITLHHPRHAVMAPVSSAAGR